MKQTLFVLHSLNGNTKDSFLNYVNMIATNMSFDVIYPIFLTSEQSSYENFKNVMQQYSNNLNENTIVIAHSISANYLIKYVYEFQLKILALISVGGAIELSPKELENMESYNSIIKKKSLPNDEGIKYAKENIKNIYLYYSDNDHHSTSQMFKNFIDTLNATPILCKGYGHFTMKHNVKDLPNIELLLKQLKTE